MRIVHISDTHLGFNRYNVLDDNGENQREADVKAAFERAIDDIVSLEPKPDLLLHTGDVFHTVHPSNNALLAAFRGFRRLRKAGIPAVVIGGEHDTPRYRGTGNVLHLLELAGAKVASVDYTTFEFAELETLIHCLPQSQVVRGLPEDVDIAPNRQYRYNLLMAHANVENLPEFAYRMDGGQRVTLPPRILNQSFSYIALGHFHYQQPTDYPRTWYAGSVERMRFSETHDKYKHKGYLLIDFDEDGAPKVERRKIKIRKMLDLDPIDAKEMDTAALMRAIERELAPDEIKKAFVRLNVRNVQPSLRRGLDYRRLNELKKPARYVEENWTGISHAEGDEQRERDETTIDPIDVEFQRFMRQQTELQDDVRSALEHEGRRRLQAVLTARQEEERQDADNQPEPAELP